MNIEKWERWIPIKNLTEKYEIFDISDDISKDLKINLKDEINKENQIQLLFEYSVDIYRITRINFKQKTLNKLSNEYGLDFYKQWTFFKVYDSEYLKWLSIESDTVTESITFTHYCIISPKYMIDIVVGYEPKIKIIN